jgi:hypothetical protein
MNADEADGNNFFPEPPIEQMSLAIDGGQKHFTLL